MEKLSHRQADYVGHHIGKVEYQTLEDIILYFRQESHVVLIYI